MSYFYLHVPAVSTSEWCLAPACRGGCAASEVADRPFLFVGAGVLAPLAAGQRKRRLASARRYTWQLPWAFQAGSHRGDGL